MIFSRYCTVPNNVTRSVSVLSSLYTASMLNKSILKVLEINGKSYKRVLQITVKIHEIINCFFLFCSDGDRPAVRVAQPVHVRPVPVPRLLQRGRRPGRLPPPRQAGRRSRQPVGPPRLPPGRAGQRPPQPPPAAPGRRRPGPQSFSRRRAQCRLLASSGSRGRRRRRPVPSLSPAQRHGHGGPGFDALPLLRLGRAESLLLPQHGKFLQSLGKCAL